ncbi:MAG: Rrf2 family transcriptional regulator [Vallitaleaceae bacterium]|nr:Rrf2 family transcriptional regulator [Vallitaleaceae bacterium]
MKLSTKGRYGLRAMIDIGMFSTEEKVSIKSIAERQHISENYLEQLIALLKKAKLVTSSRGARGGYSLSRASDKISLGEILRALEGDLNPVDCVTNNKDNVCEDSDSCATKFVWKKISDSINEVVNNITLKDLVDEQFEIDHLTQEAHIG